MSDVFSEIELNEMGDKTDDIEKKGEDIVDTKPRNLRDFLNE